MRIGDGYKFRKNKLFVEFKHIRRHFNYHFPLKFIFQILPFSVSPIYIEPSGAKAIPIGLYFASRVLTMVSIPAKPSAKTSYSPEGFPSLKGTKPTK
jgi:hypothetical protein